MDASEIVANVIFSAGWVIVGAAVLYSRRRKAAREAEMAVRNRDFGASFARSPFGYPELGGETLARSTVRPAQV